MNSEERDSAWRTSLLSELYLKWVTSPEGESQILKLIKQVLDDVQKPPQNSHLSSSSVEEFASSNTAHTSGTSSAGQRSLTSVKTTDQFIQSSPLRDAAPQELHSGPPYLTHFDPRHGSLRSTSPNDRSASFQRNAASEDDIPCFYSKNLSQGFLAAENQEEIVLLDDLLEKFENSLITKDAFGEISSLVFKVPQWMKNLLFDRIVERTQGSGSPEELTVTQISDFYRNICANITQTRRLFEIIKMDTSRNYITLEDLKTMTTYLVTVHSGLEFLKQPEFQDYYCRSVAIRMMYTLEHQQAKKILWQDFNRSSLPDVVHQLDAIDVNDEHEYFSYEHFYVLYCKFWELDTDRDLHLNYFDLCNYGLGMLTPLVVKRVVDGYGRPLSSGSKKFLDYEDFIYFCLSEEDKNSQAAVYYWFKVLDLDADGILSGYELSFFVSENQQRLAECFGADNPPSYEDMLCQMLDMLGVDPQRMKTNNGGLTLADFRACPTPANFFNMVFNASKFCAFVSREPCSEKDMLKLGKTDWVRFAREEYKRMSDQVLDD